MNPTYRQWKLAVAKLDRLKTQTKWSDSLALKIKNQEAVVATLADQLKAQGYE